MKYSSYIDNVTASKWGFTIQMAYLFDWIYSLPSWATSITTDEGTFYFASKTKAVEELPLLTDKVDTIYRYYKHLHDQGFIILKKVDGKDFIALTSKSKLWGRTSGRSEKNPSRSGNKSEKVTENNPTYKTTIQDKITFEDSTESSSNEPELFTDTKSQKPINTKRVKKEKKGAHPAFSILKDHWQKVVHPEWVSWGGMEAKNLNEIIGKMTRYSIAKRRKETAHYVDDEFAKSFEPTTDDLLKFFTHFCKALPNFYKTATLNVLNSKFDGIIEEIRTGTKPVGHSQKNSADRFSDFYGRV